MYIDIAAEGSVLWRSGLSFVGPHDCVMLRARNHLFAQPAFCVFNIWIADPERQVESALVVFSENVEVALGGGVVASPDLVRNGIEAQTNLVSPNHGTI